MARRRFFVDRVRNGTAEIEGDDARHLTQVLRVEAGQRYEISDNRQIYLAEVELARKQHVVFRVIETLPEPEPRAPITLIASLIKFERLELMLEKATELGVGAIQLVRAERSEKGLEIAAPKRMERWRRIMLESSQQSRRARLPELAGPAPLKQVLNLHADYRLFLDEERTGIPILKSLAGLQPGQHVAVLIGPEGGWPDHERAAAQDAGWLSVSLGPHVLRTETAAIAALSVVNSVMVSGGPNIS
jgi:16S rRNA (uracil1498-N3)-methyltransferase